MTVLSHHLLAHLWTFPGGGAVFRPLQALPAGLLDRDAAERALATGAPTPPDAEPFLATHETNIQSPRVVWAVV
ncbi:MAG: hypothetical protein ACR2HR_09370 [Euzebya sp.]